MEGSGIVVVVEMAGSRFHIVNKRDSTFRRGWRRAGTWKYLISDNLKGRSIDQIQTCTE